MFPYGSSEWGAGPGQLGHEFLWGMMLLFWKDKHMTEYLLLSLA